MSLSETMLSRIDLKFNTSYQDQIADVMGSGYRVGMDVGYRLLWLLDKGNYEDIKPPIFATVPELDVGESAGFIAQLGIPPGYPINEVAEIIMNRFGLETDFVYVVNEVDLTSSEKVFMTGRLPAVRICPVFPSVTAAAVA